MSQKRPTLKQVAEHVGVHVSTASRALDPRTRHLITDDVVQRVSEAARALDYRPNRIAAGLRTRRMRSIGIVVPDITNTLFPPIIKGIEDRIAAEDYVAMIGNTDGDAERERVVIEAFLTRGIEGLVVASARIEDDAIHRAVREGTAVVTVNRRVADEAVSSVVPDDHAGIGAAMKHLVDLGHKDIAFLSGPLTSSTGRERLTAFRFWTGHYRLGGDVVIEADAFREADGERCAQALIAAGECFTALVCANDLLAFGAISVFRKHGIACPKDVSVTGFNDNLFADRFDPPLTTIHVESYQAGWKAAEILLDDIAAEPSMRTPKHIVTPVALIVRGSTGPVTKF